VKQQTTQWRIARSEQSAEDRDRKYLGDHCDCYRPHNDEIVQKPHGYALTLHTAETGCECDADQRVRW